MKVLSLLVAMVLFSHLAFASENDFYANPKLIQSYPEAFALSPESIQFHQELEVSGKKERENLIKAILAHPQLHQGILQFEKLALEEQVVLLREIFMLECQVLKITPPELIIDEASIPGYAFFEFDINKGGAGKVYLNSKKLKEEKNKTDFIILLIHETRHSAQFQLALNQSQDALSRGYKSSFVVQKELKEKNVKVSFCDFMLLLNEFEAFQFANYVYGSLTQWQVPINDMGTLASQFDHNGSLRLNLLNILNLPGPELVHEFNLLEQEQYQVLHEH